MKLPLGFNRKKVIISARWRYSCSCARHKNMYGSGGIAPLISNIGASCKWSSSHTGHVTAGETPPPSPANTCQSSDTCGRIWGSAFWHITWNSSRNLVRRPEAKKLLWWLVVDARILLKWILKYDWMAWTLFVWLWIATGDGLLLTL